MRPRASQECVVGYVTSGADPKGSIPGHDRLCTQQKSSERNQEQKRRANLLDQPHILSKSGPYEFCGGIDHGCK